MTRNDGATNGGTKSETSGERVVDEAGHDGEKRNKPMYVLTPVDRYGDNKGEIDPLQDLGIYIMYMYMYDCFGAHLVAGNFLH